MDSGGIFNQLTLEQKTRNLVFFPLLQNPSSYDPDEINLSIDKEVGILTVVLHL